MPNFTRYHWTGVGEEPRPSPDTRNVFLDTLRVFNEACGEYYTCFRVTLYVGLVSYGEETFSGATQAENRAEELAKAFPNACKIQKRRYRCILPDPF